MVTVVPVASVPVENVARNWQLVWRAPQTTTVPAVGAMGPSHLVAVVGAEQK